VRIEALGSRHEEDRQKDKQKDCDRKITAGGLLAGKEDVGTFERVMGGKCS
jgi:hypothetical protein